MIDTLYSNNTIDGKLSLQTIAMSSDSNANGHIFGGWLFSQMDLSGAAAANIYSPTGQTATVAVNNIQFYKCVQVGNLVSCYTKLEKKGQKSITFVIELWGFNYKNSFSYLAAKGHFTYVAIDKDGTSIKLKAI